MKIAICLFGNLGNKKRSEQRGIKSKKQLQNENNNELYDPSLGYNHLKKLILNKYDTDIFFHCWSNNELHKKKLINLYKPKKYIIEKQKDFNFIPENYGINVNDITNFNSYKTNDNAKIGYFLYLDSRVKKRRNKKYIIDELKTQIYRTSSRLYSTMMSVNLKKDYELENNINYDYVLICRFDSFWNFPYHHKKNKNNKFILDINKLNNKYIYCEKRNRRKDYNNAIYDLWIFSNSKNSNIIGNLFKDRFKYCIRCPFSLFELIKDKIGIDKIKNIYNMIGINLGSGKWKYNNWIGLDTLNGNYLDNTSIFPYKDNYIKYMFSNHFFEHINDETAIQLLKESYRVLKKDGIVRIIVPDFDKLINKYKENNVNYFIKEIGFKGRSEWRKHNVVNNLENILMHWICNYDELNKNNKLIYRGPPKNISKKIIKTKALSLNPENFSKWACSLIPNKKNIRTQHINYWSYDKFKKILENIGFKNIIKSNHMKSKIPDVMNSKKFDNLKNRSKFSLYIECQK